MGNSKSCIDCPKKVPKSVKALDSVFESQCFGRRVYKFFTNKEWTKVEDNQYLCQDCLCKRSERVRQEEEQQREEQYRIEAQRQRERECQIEQLREQRQLVEQQQLEEQRQLVEQQRLAKQRQLVEQQRLLVVEQSRLKEQQQLEEQRRLVEQQRLEKQRQLVEQQRLEEQRRLAQHHRLEEQRRFVQQQRLEEQHRLTEQHLEQQRRSEQQSLIGKNQNRLIVPGEQQLQVEENQCTQSNNSLNEEIRQYETQRQLQNQQHFVNYQWLAQLHPLDIQQQWLRQYMNCENQALQQRFNNIQVTIQALSNWKTQITERRKRITQLRLEKEYEQAEIEAKHQQHLQMVQMRKREDEVRQAEAKRLLERQQQIVEIKRKEEQAEIEAIHKKKLQLVQMRKREEEIRQAEAKRLLEKQEQICERQRKEQEMTQRVLERQRELRHADHIVLNQPKIIQTTDKIPVKFLSIRDNTQITLRNELSFNERKSSLSLKYIKKSPKSNKHLKDEMAKDGYLSTRIYIMLDTIISKIESCKIYYSTSNNTLMQTFKQHKTEICTISDDVLADCIFEICCGVMHKKQFWPRNTQILSLLILVNKLRSGHLLQIHTGEGKTCIIAMFSALIAISGKYVDVISSSSVLADRDSKEWAEFFNIFEIDVNCNLLPKENEDRLKCYKSHIVYGTVGSFASDILRQEFLMENVRGDRKFDIVVVDEVDCLLLDQGINFTYLSHGVPGMRHLEPLLLMIWNEVIRHPAIASDTNNLFLIGAIEPFHILFTKLIGKPEKSDELLFMLNRESIFTKDITSSNQQHPNHERFNCPGLFDISVNTILRCMKFVERQFGVQFEPYLIHDHMKLKVIPRKFLNKTSRPFPILILGKGLVCALYKEEKFLCELIARKLKTLIFHQDFKSATYSIPIHLSQFVQSRLTHWIENAFIAKYMKVGREYLIKDDDIVPIDFESTGVLEIDTKWGDCLHQFLEIKHEKPLSEITLVTNFMSNQTFFHRYTNKIFGVSGTLGSHEEEMYLQRTYNLHCRRIPTFCPKQFSEYATKILPNQTEWISAIRQTVENHIISSNPTAVLVVCEDINTTQRVRDVIAEKCKSIYMFTRNDEESKTIDRTFRKGEVIVATNIAGRGTDINLEKNVCHSGGLFVLVTFLPLNQRVEDQIFGRTARKGEPGSAQLILDRSSLNKYFGRLRNINEITDMRNKVEKQRIIEIEKNLLQNVKCKEALFSHYCNFLRDVKNEHNLTEIEMKIVYNSLHEYWGMWLKEHCDFRSKENLILIPLKLRLQTKLQIAMRKVIQRKSPSANISHVIKFANEEMKSKNFEKAEQMFTRAIDVDEKRAAVAYYNRALCRIQMYGTKLLNGILQDLKQAEKSFEKFKQEAFLCLSLLDTSQFKGNTNDENLTKKQILIRCHVLEFLSENISQIRNDILHLYKNGKEIRADCKSIFMIALGDENSCKKIDSEVHILWDLGLLDVMTVQEGSHFHWSSILVAFVGVLQVAFGTAMVTFSHGILWQLGWNCITAGIRDILRAVYSMYKKQPMNVNSWINEKLCQIVLSVTCLGFEHIVREVPFAKEALDSLQSVNIFEGDKSFTHFQEIASTTLKTAENAFKLKCKKARQEVEYGLNRTDIYFLSVIYSTVEPNLKMVGLLDLKIYTKKYLSTGEFSFVLENFILYWGNLGKRQIEINDIYWNTVKSLISAKNVLKFRPIVLGFIKRNMRNVKLEMSKSDSKEYNQCFPIFELIDELELLPCSGKELLSEYCDFVKCEIFRVYGNKLQTSRRDIGSALDFIHATRNVIAEETVNFLYEMIQNAFKYTCSELVANKMNTNVENFVSKKSKHDRVDVLENILQLSETAIQFAEAEFSD